MAYPSLDSDGKLPLSFIRLDTAVTPTKLWTFPVGPTLTMQVVNSANTYGGTGPLLDDGSGFFGEFQAGSGSGVGLSANRCWTFPDSSGTIVLSGVADTLKAGNLSTFNATSASSGASFTDTVTATKKLRMVLVNSVGNNSFTIANTAARDYAFGNLSGFVPLVGSAAATPAAGLLTKLDSVAATANVVTTNLSNTPPAGQYQLQAIFTTDTTDAGAGTATLTIGWTDSLGATTDATCHIDLATYDRKTLNIPLYIASGNVTYAVSNGGGAYGTAKWTLHLRVIYLG